MLQMSSTEGKILDMQLGKERQPIENLDMLYLRVWRDHKKKRLALTIL